MLYNKYRVYGDVIDVGIQNVLFFIPKEKMSGYHLCKGQVLRMHGQIATVM
jgi:hypothetical protein